MGNNYFECCMKCLPPKRHPGCHDTCEEYLKDKKGFNELKEKIRKSKHLENDIYNVSCKRNPQRYKVSYEVKYRSY